MSARHGEGANAVRCERRAQCGIDVAVQIQVGHLPHHICVVSHCLARSCVGADLDECTHGDSTHETAGDVPSGARYRQLLDHLVLHCRRSKVGQRQGPVQPGATGIGNEKLVGLLSKMLHPAEKRFDYRDVVHHRRLYNCHGGWLSKQLGMNHGWRNLRTTAHEHG